MARIENFVGFVRLYFAFVILCSLGGEAGKPQVDVQSKITSSDHIYRHINFDTTYNKIVKTIKEDIIKFCPLLDSSPFVAGRCKGRGVLIKLGDKKR